MFRTLAITLFQRKNDEFEIWDDMWNIIPVDFVPGGTSNPEVPECERPREPREPASGTPSPHADERTIALGRRTRRG